MTSTAAAPAPPTSASSSSPDDSSDALSTARRILLSAPPGQFDLILADLQKLLQVSPKPPSDNDDHGSAAPDAQGLSKEWIADTRRLYGEKTGSALLHYNGSDDGDGGGGGERCAQLRSKMTRYMSSSYSASSSKDTNSAPTSTTAASFAVRPKSTSPDDVILRTYAESVDMANYHSGSWYATYDIQVLSSTSASVRGCVVLRSHAFEMGNVQLRSERNLGPITVSANQAGDWADAVLGQIQRWERGDVQASLSDMYDNRIDGRGGASGGMLKSLRRVMPVTRTRMDWNVGGHRLVRTLNDTKKM